MKQSLMDRIRNSRLWVLLCGFFASVLAHIKGTRENDTDRLERFLKTRNGEPIRGLFLDKGLTVDRVNWMKYPPGVQWDVVRTYRQFKTAMQWTKYDLYSVSYQLYVTSHTGKDCLNLLNGLRCIGQQDPIAVFIHDKSQECKKALLQLWPTARLH